MNIIHRYFILISIYFVIFVTQFLCEFEVKFVNIFKKLIDFDQNLPKMCQKSVL